MNQYEAIRIKLQARLNWQRENRWICRRYIRKSGSSESAGAVLNNPMFHYLPMPIPILNSMLSNRSRKKFNPTSKFDGLRFEGQVPT